MTSPGAPGAGKLLIKGLPMAPGLAVGHPVFHTENELDIPVLAIREPDVPAEQRRLSAAITRARKHLAEVEESIGKEVGSRDARIFSVQGLLLEDPSFRKGMRDRIKEQLVNAEVAVRDEVMAWEGRFAAVAAGTERDPSADLRDIGRQIQRELAGRPRTRLGSRRERVILVTRELLPSDAAQIDRGRLAAIVTASGGVASHAAILARGLGIPAVTGIDVAALPGRGGRWVVDGSAGVVIVNPTRSDLAQAEQRSRDYQQFRAELMAQSRGFACTADGVAIDLQLNVENFEELPTNLVEDLRGVGLYRTEFLFMHRPTFPSEEEQYRHYVGALEKLAGREITFRTIDVGGDKPLSYLSVPHEPNPVLGWRGVRLSLEWPDVFYSQLRALLRASAHGRLRILLPLVTMVEELRQAREIVQELQSDLIRREIPFDPAVPLGVMIEVPAAAMSAGILAREADFLSIGTNDLSQYALAVDRNNARVAALYQPLHPGLLRIVRYVVEAAGLENTPVSLCGEMAGDPEATLLLLGMGLRSFSMSPYHLPTVKRLIGAVRLADAQDVARQACELGSTTEVRALLRRHTLRLVPDLAAWLRPEG
ncbi:MAG: phosphoenolpyruvate--protein phosphotransferase [Planctomycetota bacterium]